MGVGPLSGVRVVEFAGLGPAPFCGMLLSDLGADVVRIDRRNGGGRTGPKEILNRGRRSIALDLKNVEHVEICLRLFESADATFEGFRPGVMERMGLGPVQALARNPKIVYGRMTGWGRPGRLLQALGTTSTTSRSLAHFMRSALQKSPSRRSTSSATLVGVRSILRWAFWPASSMPGQAGKGRW